MRGHRCQSRTSVFSCDRLGVSVFSFFSLTPPVVVLFLGDGPCLGSRLPNQPYKWLSYKEVKHTVELPLVQNTEAQEQLSALHTGSVWSIPS